MNNLSSTLQWENATEAVESVLGKVQHESARDRILQSHKDRSIRTHTKVQCDIYGTQQDVQCREEKTGTMQTKQLHKGVTLFSEELTKRTKQTVLNSHKRMRFKNLEKFLNK